MPVTLGFFGNHWENFIGINSFHQPTHEYAQKTTENYFNDFVNISNSKPIDKVLKTLNFVIKIGMFWE